jgi:phosphoribosylglycinamide formyltransferase 2
VIIALQRFGVEVIAVDRYANAPGHQVAHRAYTIDMTDSAQLKALIKQEKPHFIVPEIEALNTDVLAEVENEKLATVIPTVKAVQLTMNREGIRRLAAEELQLAVSPYAFARNEAELQAAIDGGAGKKGIGYPCLPAAKANRASRKPVK